MTALYRVRTALTGFAGAPGVSTMYFLDQQTAVASVHAFWEALSLYLPLTVTAQVESSGDIIESTTGALTGAWSSDPVAAVVGQQGGPYAAAAGGVVTWLTETIADNHRLRGRTFIVPLIGIQFAADGTLSTEVQAAMNAAGEALIFEQSLSFVVWHRPREARAATPTSPAVTARVGSHGLITGHRVPDMSAVLRSRRD